MQRICCISLNKSVPGGLGKDTAGFATGPFVCWLPNKTLILDL